VSRRALLGAALGVGVALAAIQTAAAEERMELDPSSGPCRALITVRGFGFPPGERGAVFARESHDDEAQIGGVHSVPLDGTFEFEAPAVTLGPDCPPGDEMPVFVRYGDHERLVTSPATATYTAAGPTPPASGAARLGARSAPSSPAAALGGALACVLLLGGRRSTARRQPVVG
jgi:hypothetical protein